MLRKSRHPNCKCELEEIKQTDNNNKQSEYKACDCLDRIQKIRENISKLISNMDLFLKNNIQNELEDFSYNLQKIEELLKELNIEYNLTKDEIGKHQPGCSIKPDEMCKSIYQKIQDLKQIQNKYVNNSNSLFEIKSTIEELKKYLERDLVFEADVLLDNRENNFHHQKNECEFEDRINRLNQTISKVSTKLASEYQEINNMKAFRNKLNDELIAMRNFIDENERKRQVKCYCENSVREKTLMERIDEFGAKNASKSDKLILAGSNLQDAMNDFEYARKNDDVGVVNSRLDVKNEELIKALDKANVPNNSRGVVYSPLSAQSQKLFKQTEIQQFIRNHYEELKRGDYKSKIVNIEFTNKGIFKLEDSDAYLALQHCELCNPIITEDGYFQAKIVDYYDFSRREGGKTIKQKISKEINNWGHSMQEKGYLENFFVVYYINEKL